MLIGLTHEITKLQEAKLCLQSTFAMLGGICIATDNTAPVREEIARVAGLQTVIGRMPDLGSNHAEHQGHRVACLVRRQTAERLALGK